MIKACLFSLDGVIVDTARCRFLAWKRLAAELGFEFTELQNESLREGEISQLFTAGQNSLVMKCLKSEDDGVLPFDQIEGTLKSQMQTKKASSVIENEVKKAEVKEKRGRLEAADLQRRCQKARLLILNSITF